MLLFRAMFFNHPHIAVDPTAGAAAAATDASVIADHDAYYMMCVYFFL